MIPASKQSVDGEEKLVSGGGYIRMKYTLREDAQGFANEMR